jgi:hypothetical protein
MKCPGLHCEGCGSGTVTALAVPAVLIAAGAVVAEAVLEIIWWLVAVLAVSAVLAVALAVAVVPRLAARRDRQDAAAWAALRPAQLPAEPVTPLPRAERPVLEQHVHYHYHAAGGEQAAAIIRQALPGRDAVTERK